MGRGLALVELVVGNGSVRWLTGPCWDIQMLDGDPLALELVGDHRVQVETLVQRAE